MINTYTFGTIEESANGFVLVDAAGNEHQINIHNLAANQAGLNLEDLGKVAYGSGLGEVNFLKVSDITADNSSELLKAQNKIIREFEENNSHIFYPEMEEVSNPKKIFFAQYIWKSYSLEWSAENDQKAREILKSLKVRAKKGSEKISESSSHLPTSSKIYGCLITYDAMQKLLKSGNVSLSLLLD